MQSDELTAIEPQAASIEIGEELYDITPLTVGQLPAFTRAIEPVLPEVMAAVRMLDGGTIPDTVISRLLLSCDSLIEAVCVGSRVHREVLDQQTLDVLVRLASVVISVNSDFFARVLVPAATEAIQQAAGMTSSSDSSEQDSLETTS